MWPSHCHRFLLLQLKSVLTDAQLYMIFFPIRQGLDPLPTLLCVPRSVYLISPTSCLCSLGPCHSNWSVGKAPENCHSCYRSLSAQVLSLLWHDFSSPTSPRESSWPVEIEAYSFFRKAFSASMLSSSPDHPGSSQMLWLKQFANYLQAICLIICLLQTLRLGLQPSSGGCS